MSSCVQTFDWYCKYFVFERPERNHYVMFNKISQRMILYFQHTQNIFFYNFVAPYRPKCSRLVSEALMAPSCERCWLVSILKAS